MADLGSIRAQQAGARSQALRQPARARRERGAAHGARRVHAAPGRREHLGGAVGGDHRVGPRPSKAELFEPAGDKIYRHPTFFVLPDEINHT